jgi:hypothetical protein
MVFDDSTDLAIATEFKISHHTVHTHMRHIYRKLAVSNRVQLVLRVTHEFVRLSNEVTHSELLRCGRKTLQRCTTSSRNKATSKTKSCAKEKHRRLGSKQMASPSLSFR